MFSKVFKVDKKLREIATHPRPANDQRATYHPLLPSSLHDHKKRVTIADVSSLDQDLDLLELVNRSDSLHKRLDELQAKYERMDDGMQNITREAHLKGMEVERKKRPFSGMFNTMRTSKSFEDPEPKKPGFFQKIFRNRLSKSEDDLLDDSSTDHKTGATEGGGEENNHSVTPILKERRSASEDILSTKDLLLHPPDKRQGWSKEFLDLGDGDDILMPPPPPPDDLLSLNKCGGLKRKRVIRVYNLSPLDHKTPYTSSTESCDSINSYQTPDQRVDDGCKRVDDGCNFPHCKSMNDNKNVVLTSYRHLDVTKKTSEARAWERADRKYEPSIMTHHNSWSEGTAASRSQEEVRTESLGGRRKGFTRENGWSEKEFYPYKNDDRLGKETTIVKSQKMKELPHSTTSNADECKFLKDSSLQELSKSGNQDLPARLPATASIEELDHFLTAIIQNLESQLLAGGSLNLKQQPRNATVAKRKKKKRKEDDEELENTKGKKELQIHQRNDQRMSECGACGRRWVEPRLLPCLHTVCTPCLYTRAALITPSAAVTSTASSAHGQDTSTSIPGPQHTGCGGAPQERMSMGSSSSLSTVSSNATSTITMAAPAPSATVVSSKPLKFTLTSTITYNGGNLNRHCDGEGSGGHPSLTSGSSGDSWDEGDPRSTSARASPHNTQLHNGISAEGNHQPVAQISDQPASDDLDSMIELLTNLSPNISNSSNITSNSNHTPKQTLTSTSNLSEPHIKAGSSLPEEEIGSPSSTIDSRCSSRTRSSGRSSDSEGRVRDRGMWVVWCPECGYEAQVPPGGVECFPLNYVLQKQLVLEALNSSSTTVYCDLCHDDVVAEERCNTCPVNLCRLCSHAHTRQRRTARHVVISLQEARSLGIREVAHTLVCATHGEGEVGWWCRSCHEPLCAACLATLHRGHPTLTVDQEAPQARRNLNALLEQASTRMGYLLSTVEELTGAASRVQHRGKTVSDQVNAFIDDYILALEEHRHTLLRQVRQACERAQRGIVTESQRAGQIASWLRQGCDLTHDLLNHAGDAEALALAPLVMHRLQALLAEQVRGWTRWERLALLREHHAGRVRGYKIHGVIADAPAAPNTSRLKPLCNVTSLIAGSRVSVLVVARDVDGQPITHGGEDLMATVLTRDGNALCGCSIRDREDGSYEITFSPPVPCTALLHVTILGFHVQGSPLEMTVVSLPNSTVRSSSDMSRDGVSGRQHTGVFHCCTFCSSGGDKTASCACGATMPGGYQGCGHNHSGHPGHKHWSCCAQASPSAPCTRPPSQYYQVTL